MLGLVLVASYNIREGGWGGSRGLYLKMGYSRKIQTGGSGFSETSPALLEFFIFLLYPWKFQTKQSCATLFPQNCGKLGPLPFGNSKAKNRPPGNSKLFYFFLVTLRKYTGLLHNPWKFHKLPLDTPPQGNSISSTQPPCFDFFLNSLIATGGREREGN